MLITSIRQMDVPATTFSIPVTYRKSESSEEKLTPTQVQTLSMEP